MVCNICLINKENENILFQYLNFRFGLKHLFLNKLFTNPSLNQFYVSCICTFSILFILNVLRKNSVDTDHAVEVTWNKIKNNLTNSQKKLWEKNN